MIFRDRVWDGVMSSLGWEDLCAVLGIKEPEARSKIRRIVLSKRGER